MRHLRRVVAVYRPHGLVVRNPNFTDLRVYFREPATEIHGRPVHRDDLEGCPEQPCPDKLGLVLRARLIIQALKLEVILLVQPHEKKVRRRVPISILPHVPYL